MIFLRNSIESMIDKLTTPFFKICFVQIGTAATSAALLIFVSLKVCTSMQMFNSFSQFELNVYKSSQQIELFPAVALAVSAIFQVISYCAVGTMIEICVRTTLSAMILIIGNLFAFFEILF